MHCKRSAKRRIPMPRTMDQSVPGCRMKMEEVWVWTVAVPSGTEWLAPHDGRDRMVVTLGRTRQLPADRDSAFPARWACVPPNSDFKVPNETYHTRNFMIVEFNNANNSHETSPEEKESPS